MLKISKASNFRYIVYAAKSGVLVLVSLYLFEQLKGIDVLAALGNSLLAEVLKMLPIVIVLCLINWSLEAAKWCVLSKPLWRVGFKDALKGVISGLSISLIIPAGIGDSLGRLGYFETRRKIEATALIYFGGFIQFLVTTVFGVYGVFILLQKGVDITVNTFSTFFLLTSFLAILAVALLIKLGGKWSERVSGVISKVILAFRAIHLKDFLSLIGLAALRYVVFGLQLYLLFVVVGVKLPTPIIVAGITWMYFAKTVLPTFNFLADLGVREFSAVLFFELYHVDAQLIVASTLMLWLINIFLPSLIGLYFVLKARLQPVVVS